MFTRAAQSVMDTTITKVVSADEDNEQTCWTEYDGDNPDYFLSHVQDFLFGSHLQARSPGDNELPSDYAVSVELDNDARQSFFPTESGATHYLDTRGKTNYDFPLQITNTRLFLFRSQIGLLVYTLKFEPKITVSETSLLDRISVESVRASVAPKFSQDPEELYWGENALCNRSADSSMKRKTKTRTLTLDDLVFLNYQISRHPSEDGAPVGPRLYLEDRVRRDQDLFMGDSNAPEWTPPYVDILRPFNLGLFTWRLLTASLGNQATTKRRGNTTSKTGISWRPFHEHRYLTYIFGLIDSERMDGPCNYDRFRRRLYYLRRSFNEKYQPTLEQLQDTDNPEVLRTFENIAFGFSTEGGAVLAWPGERNRLFITQQLPIRIRRNYFFLYVLALHQHYACMHLARRIGDLDYEEGRVSSTKTIETARYLREKIFAFLVQSWFQDVSDRRIYNQVYHRWQRVLDTRRHFDEVKSQVGEVDDYLQRVKNDRESRFADLISWVVVPVILFLNAVSVNFVEMQGISVTNRMVWVGTALATALYFVIALTFRRYIR